MSPTRTCGVREAWCIKVMYRCSTTNIVGRSKHNFQMSRLGERLAHLNQINEGLLCRSHWLTSFEKPPTINEEIEKVCQRIVKKFPDKDFDGLDKIQGYNIFRDRSIEIMASLDDFYHHILNVHKFRTQTVAVLNETTNRILEFNVSLVCNFSLSQVYYFDSSMFTKTSWSSSSIFL